MRSVIGFEDLAARSTRPANVSTVHAPRRTRRSAAQASERANLWVAGAGVVAICIAIAWPLLTGRVQTDTDLGNFHLPMRFFQAEALARGFDFLWFPYAYAGFHLHGEGQASLYHPLQWAMYRWLPLDVAFGLEVVRNYVLLVLGGWVCLRRFGVRRDAALLGAALFAFGSFNAMHFMHLNAIAIMAHLPWKIWLIDIALRSPRSDRAALAAVGLSLATASQLLFGHPQFVWLSMVVEGAFAAFVLWRGVGRWRWPWLGGALVLGFAVAGVQLLPQWETLGLSHRADPGVDFAYTFSLQPVNLLQVVSPLFFRARAVGGAEATEFAVYMGSLMPVLLAWGALRLSALGPWRSAMWAASGLAIFALGMALGDHGPIYWLQGELPVLRLLRAPARYVGVMQAALALMAAIAFADLARVCERGGLPPARRLLWLGVPLLLAAIAFGLGLSRPFAESVARAVSGPVRLAYGLVAIAVFSLGVVLAARGVRIALPILLGLALLDVGVYGVGWMIREPPVTLEQFIHDRTLPEWTERHRLHWGPPSLTMRHVRMLSGYSAMVPKRRLRTDRYELGNRPPPPEVLVALRVAGVGWAYGRPIPDPLPRVRLVGEAQRADRLQEQLLRIDPETTAIVHGDVVLGGDAPGSVIVIDDLPGRLRVETNAPSPQLLVFAESHHPGWRARVDGSEAPLMRAYGDFIGVPVPAGVHEIELDFDPESVRIGSLISLAGLAGMLPLYLGARRSASSATAPPEETRS